MKAELKNAVTKTVRGETDKKEKDAMLKLVKEQGYVKEECRLPGMVVFLLVKEGKNPCDGCNHFDCKDKKEEDII